MQSNLTIKINGLMRNSLLLILYMCDFLYKSQIKTRKFDYVTSRLDIDLDLGLSIALDHTSGP